MVERVEAEKEGICERKIEEERLNLMKPSSGLRCYKQEGNLNQGPFLIESLLRTL